MRKRAGHGRSGPARARRATGRTAAPILLLALLGALVPALTAPPAAADGPCEPSMNEIQCENSLPGSPPSEWDTSGAGDPTLQGFAMQFSVDQGETVGFKVDTTAPAYTVDIYRVGWYQGDGARHIATLAPAVPLPQVQPGCLSDPPTGLVDCGNWDESGSWAVPESAVSGVYFARLRRPDTGGTSHVFFVVRDDDGGSSIVFQTDDTTWQAYNGFGGNSLYSGSPVGRAYKVSYNRPFDTRASWPHVFFWQNQYSMVRFMERNGYDLSYISGIDTDARGAELLEHSVFVSAGHDEYWSKQQRANVEAARDAGVNLAFFSGNEVFWKTRWESSIDGSGTERRTLVSYKETIAGAKIDPSAQWTGTWRDPRFSPPADGGDPENRLTGTRFIVNGMRNDTITVPAAEGQLRLWRNTSIAALGPGQTASLAPSSLGYEWDEVPDDGTRPPGLIRLSDTTVPIDDGKYLLDHGSTYGNGTANHALAMYRAQSGALVFSAGTIRWSWGLATDNADDSGAIEDSRMQQATVNLFADMGAQPATLQAGLTAATASTDAVPPVATITNPTSGANVQVGTPVTISGTATDSGGGLVGGVEVSFDGGASWRLATGRTNWSYVWTPTQSGTITVQVRAVDDSLNVQDPAHTVTVDSESVCPCSIWTPTAAPPGPPVSETLPVELGVKFRSDVAGQITGVRFFKDAGNTGAHVGNLWSSSGTLLASATFSGESASGWQEVSFSSPVTIQADTTYVASYFAPNGRYAASGQQFLTAGVDNGPLHALRSGVDGANGVFRYGAASGFPTDTYQASNYWVDVVLDDSGGEPDVDPPTVTSTTPAAGATGVATSVEPAATFSEPVQPASVVFELSANGSPVAGAASYDAATNTSTFTPSATLAPSTTFSATVGGAQDLAGNEMTAVAVWSFTTAPAVGAGPFTIFPAGVTPAVAAHDDSGSVELGVKFRSDVAGSVTGVRFFKGSGNTGAHVGNLWSASGQLLASATFSGESASGWQQVSFSSPVAIQADTTYVASYFAPNGHYALDNTFFSSSGFDNPPLHGLASGSSGGNGVYAYGAASGFPTDTYQASNYWVDVVLDDSGGEPDVDPPTVTSTTPAAGATGVATSVEPAATFSEPVQPASVVFELSANGSPVAGAASYDAATNTSTFTPSATLAPSTTFSATVGGAQDLAGNEMTAVAVWSFTTAPAVGAGPFTIFPAGVTPAVAAHDDSGSVELGVKFRSDVAGSVTGVRFFKGSGNTGAHVGNLWSASGQLLASATFSGESASGWQQVSFSSPVAIQADTTYVASYFAPNGHYALDNTFFSSSGFDNPPLHGLASGSSGGNGVYAYGAASGFPTDTYQASNYWVDVVLDDSGGEPDVDPPTVTSTTPAAGATGVATSVEPAATFSEPVQPATISFTLRDASDAVVAGNTAYDSGSRTVAFAPSVALAPESTYTVTVEGAQDTAGNLMIGPVAWSFTTAPAVGAGPFTIWSAGATPSTAAWPDTGSVELGVKFRSDVAGSITGVRFFKGAGNTGTHVGNLWSSSGTLLASATFSGESASGWQEVSFSSPVAIQADTTYVASYFAPNGHYAVDNNGLGAAVDNAPLHALASGSSGGNGVYRYGAASGFPTSSYQSTNYWVDVVFAPA